MEGRAPRREVGGSGQRCQSMASCEGVLWHLCVGDLGANARGDMLCLVINSRVAERVLLSPDAVPEGEEQGWTVENTGDIGRKPLLVAFSRSAWT